MGRLTWVFIAVLIVISIFLLFYCLIRGRGASHKKLVLFASLLGVMVLICFGGEAILNLLGMGWRCTPFNTMLSLCAVLFIVMLEFGMKELSILKGTNSAIVWCGCISMLLVIIITLFSSFMYFQLSSWHDSLSILDGQTIVCSNDMHGGSCGWRYYTHINNLIHGGEITQVGWRGYPPFKS